MNYTSTMQTKTNGRSLPKGWQWVKLGDICEINPRRPALERADSALTTFVQMSAVDDLLGVVARPEQRPFSEIKKGYTYFAENDVIFAKITPCMENGKHAIVSDLIDRIGFGSTEFHVIRPNENIIAEWIWHFVRQPYVRQNATNYFTGAVGQQRVPDSFLKSLEIPLPPLDEQRRIANRLNEQLAAVESARKAAEEQMQAVWQLPSAFLRDMFESEEAKKWEVKKVSELCRRIDYGYTASADFAIKEPKFLRITDIQDGKVNWDQVPGCKISSNEEQNNILSDGDIVFARTGATTGKSFLIRKPPRAVFASYLIRLQHNDKVSADYLYAFFQSDSYWRQIRENARGAAQPNVNATLLGQIALPVAPLREQERIISTISEKLAEISAMTDSLESQLAEINHLPASLLREAFAGQG